MRIGIDLQVLSERRTGIGNYAFNLVNALLSLNTAHEWVLFAPPSLTLPTWGREKIVILPEKRIPVWDSQMRYARIMRQEKLDVLHGPANVLPLTYPFFVSPLAWGRKSTVITLHDLAIYKHPEWFPRGQWFATKIVVPQSIKKADKIIVPSQATKHDLQEIFQVREDKIAVIPHGVEERFFRSSVIASATPRGNPNEIASSPASTRFPRNDRRTKYILFVGTLEPRKNLPRMIEAYHELSAGLKNEFELWIVGGKGWGEKFQMANVKFQTEGIKFLDYVNYDDLPALYQNASLFVYPSLYEGFGLPVLEAMAGGVPVITSKDSPMADVFTGKFEARSTKHEANSNDQNPKSKNSLNLEHSNLDIVSDFDIRISDFLVDPYSVQEIRDATEKLLTHAELREKMAKRGKEIAKQFTWDKTARETLLIYESLI